MSRQRKSADCAWLFVVALLLAACVTPPRRAVNVVTSLPIASPPPRAERLAPSTEPINAENAARIAALAQIGLGRLGAIALSPDGDTLAVSSSAGVRLYDALTLEARSFVETGPVELLDYASDDALITAAGRRVAKWDLASGQAVAETVQATAVVALEAPPGDTVALAQAPRVSERPEGYVMLHRSEDLAQMRSLPYSGARVAAMAASSNGEWLAVAAGNDARLWPLRGEGPGVALQGHTNRITSVAWSGTDRVVTASADGTVRVWQAADGKLLLTLDTLDDELTCVAVTSDGALIAAGSADGGLYVWRADGSLARSFHARPGALRQIVFTPDGSGLLTAGDDQTLARWRTSDWQQLARTAGYLAGVYDVAFSPDGETFATGAIRHGLVDVWRVADGGLLAHVEAHDGLGVNAVGYAPNGEFLVTGGEDNLVRLWGPGGQPGRTLAGHGEYVTSVAVSPDSEMIASGSYDKTIRLWRAVDGKNAGALQGHTSWVNSVAFSPDGKRLLSASYDRTARLWDVAAQRPIATVGQYATDATSVAYSPDGRTMAVGLSAGGEVRLLDAEGAPLRTLAGEKSEQVTGLSFSPDGALLAVSYYQGEPVRVWRVADGKLLATLAGPRDVFDVAFSPDGALLAAASGQGVVTLFGVSREQR
jgi:WD40 repeat protein